MVLNINSLLLNTCRHHFKWICCRFCICSFKHKISCWVHHIFFSWEIWAQ